MDRKIVLNARQLRSFNRDSSFVKPVNEKRITNNERYIVLDNVLDTYNIGSIFRLADAVAAKKIYLCGKTEIPPNHRIKKASINTTEWVEWEYCETATEAIRELKQQFANRLPSTDYCKKAEDGRASPKALPAARRPKTECVQIIAIEQSPKSVQYDKFEYKLPICLIVGNETHGVAKEVLDLADAVAEIPMFGVNKSLNVTNFALLVTLERSDRVSYPELEREILSLMLQNDSIDVHVRNS